MSTSTNSTKRFSKIVCTVKIALVVSSPVTARVFLSHQIQSLSKVYDLTIVSNLKGQENLGEWLPKSVKVVDITIHRKINLYHDLKALFLLLYFFYKSRFSLVHSVSPKAGLLAMLASWMVRVPTRLHTFTGQVWVTKQGVRRTLLRCLDRLISALATTVLVDSHSQRNFLLENMVVSTSGSIVLGEGSISGVDFDRFKIDPVAREKIRHDLGIVDSITVLLFVGRLKREKGVLELAEAFSRVHGKLRETKLLFVGVDEEQLYSELEQMEGVSLIPFTKIPEQYMAAADIFCLPSYREGFGSVVIEAAACGIPSIGSKIYGLSDAIVDGETGLLVSSRSVTELEAAMLLLIQNKTLRKKMGKAAHERALEKFSQSYLTEQLMGLYKFLLQKKLVTENKEE